ncbi:MAG: ComEC/Rec2 family competence protein, partial [Candidatus Pacebacteria bacterium]|nr:ComEC/Rec2 family competence protein [Candidatus Paceibacterota bacterium]
MSYSQILLGLSVAFIVGIFITSFLVVPAWLFLELFLLALLYVLIFRKEKAIVIFSLCLLVLGLGLYRGQHPATPSFSLQFLGPWQAKLANQINQNLSQPASSILAGILVGQQGQIDYQWKQKLNITGTRHITAVSGTNVLLLAEMLVILGFAIGLWLRQALWVSLI